MIRQAETQEPTSRAPLNQQSAKRLAYSAAAAAAAGMATSSEAATLYSLPIYEDIPQFTAFDFDLNKDGIGDVLLKNYVFGGNYQGGTVNYFPGKFVTSNASFPFYTTALEFGDTIGPAETAGGSFQGTFGYANNPNSEFDNAADKYIGLEFPINGASHFAWIRVTIDNAAGTFLVKDWGYSDTPGEAVIAGVAPEPGTLGLLAAGAAGVASMRRRCETA
ncbi:MAG: PEP-CTERM sorting domain-containing protein [Planctomycetota bacterium]